ncbi:hypothetical protein GC194_04355 [bacterium]|nr:hypothetical protein [bacterium]
MKTEQMVLNSSSTNKLEFSINPGLILVFGDKTLLEKNASLASLRQQFPEAIITGCTTAGEIAAEKVSDHSLVVTAVEFEKSKLQYAIAPLDDSPNPSREAGHRLAKSLNHSGLKHVLVFSDGLFVNGTELVRGLDEELPNHVQVTGGLAGDGPNFAQTGILSNDLQLLSRHIVAIGLYGEKLNVGFASRGGWDSFGVDRLVTKSDGNILYEIDGQPALDLYKSFLGTQADQLPASGLLFPLSMRVTEDREPLVRTILGINEQEKSLTFAGDIPQGSFVRLMKANADRLINGAEEAATIAANGHNHHAKLAILVSCVGRKLVLKQLVEEEVEVVSEVLGRPTIAGFYSYGELAPFANHGKQCELHNQTMTITTLTEI